jgi:hypothetical protein
MTESQLITNIKGLKSIKPNQEWVLLTKKRILGNEAKTPSMAYRFSDYFKYLTYKPVLATASAFVFFGIIGGTVSMAQNALPGDALYAVKRITEKTQGLFVSKANLAQYQADQTTKRLGEIESLAQTKQIKKLSTAVTELQQTVKELNITNADTLEAQRVIATKDKVVQALGTMVSEIPEYNNAVKLLVEREIKDLESRTMTAEQTILLESAKQDFANGEYIKALESIWLISNQTSEATDTTETDSNK